MSELTSGRRGAQPRTRFDDTGRKVLLRVLIGIGVVAVLAVAFMYISAYFPDLGLTLQLGGIPRASEALPRNFRLWAVQPDGRMRFATAFFPPLNNAPASEVFTVAGPLVNNEADMGETRYFGALNISSKVQNGENNDRGRLYRLFWVEHDPAVAAYGVDIMTNNSPYISKGSEEDKFYTVAMGAPQQTYYAQVIVAVALPPGAVVDSVAYSLPAVEGQTTATESLMRPYRRVTINGWTVYYFDQTSLTKPQTVRIRYTPPADPTKPAPELNMWEVDRQR